MMRNRDINQQSIENVEENVDERKLQENTRQAALEFASITPSILRYETQTAYNPVHSMNSSHDHDYQRRIDDDMDISISTTPTLLRRKENSVQGDGFGFNNVEESIGITSPYMQHNLTRHRDDHNYGYTVNLKEKLVNAISSVLDGSSCNEPSSFPSFSSNYVSNVDSLHIPSGANNDWTKHNNCNDNVDLQKSRDGHNPLADDSFLNTTNDLNEFETEESTNMNETLGQNDGSTVVDDNDNDLGSDSDDGLKNLVECKNCTVVRNELNEFKKQMTVNFQIMKLKVMSTDELISEHHNNVALLENEKKLVEELQTKLEICYGETGALRIQLKKALQANEPLKKTVRRFEYEKSLKQQTIDELKIHLEKAEIEVGNLKGISSTSRCTQDDYKRTIEENTKTHEKDTKKIIQQAKLIDKLHASIATLKKKQKEKDKALKKALKDNEKLTYKIYENQSKELRNDMKRKGTSPGKASKKSPIGVLSPSPSPPPTRKNRKKRVKQESVTENASKNSYNLSQIAGDNLSSSSGDDTDNEMDELLANSPVFPKISHYGIPTLLSPPLSPIPPSPVLDFNQVRSASRLLEGENPNPSETNDSFNNSVSSHCASLFGDVSQSDEDENNLTPKDNKMKMAVNKSLKISIVTGKIKMKAKVKCNDLVLENNKDTEIKENPVDQTEACVLGNECASANTLFSNVESSINVEGSCIDENLANDITDMFIANETVNRKEENNHENTSVDVDEKTISESATVSNDLHESMLFEKNLPNSASGLSPDDLNNESNAKVSEDDLCGNRTHEAIVKEKCFDDKLSEISNTTMPSQQNTVGTCVYNPKIVTKADSADENIGDNVNNLHHKLKCDPMMSTIENDNIEEKKDHSKRSSLSRRRKRKTRSMNLSSGSVSRNTRSAKYRKTPDSESMDKRHSPSDENSSDINVSAVESDSDKNLTIAMVKNEDENITVSTGNEGDKKVTSGTENNDETAIEFDGDKNITAAMESNDDTNIKVVTESNNDTKVTTVIENNDDTKVLAVMETIDDNILTVSMESDVINATVAKESNDRIGITEDNDGIVCETKCDSIMSGTISADSKRKVNNEVPDDVIKIESREDKCLIPICDADGRFSKDYDEHGNSSHSLKEGDTHVSKFVSSKPPDSVKKDISVSDQIKEVSQSINPSNENVLKDFKEKLDGIENNKLFEVSNDTSNDSRDKNDSPVTCLELPIHPTICVNIEAMPMMYGVTNILKDPEVCVTNPNNTSTGISSVTSCSNIDSDTKLKVIPKKKNEVESTAASSSTSRNIVNDMESEKVRTSGHSSSYRRHRGRVIDELDSEVASFRLAAQRSINLDTDDSSNQSLDDVVISTSAISALQNVPLVQDMNDSTRTTEPHSNSDSLHGTEGLTNANTCQCSATTTYSNPMTWTYSSRPRHSFGRRHSLYTTGIDVPAFLVSRLRVERTRSLSPSLFSPPSPPLSPIPPSPRRSILTPIISPLPTTPLPESVSPLPPSPKITSPPLIRGSSLLLSDDPSIFVPKPVSHSSSSAVKVLKFSNNDNSNNNRDNQEKDRTQNVPRSVLVPMTSSSMLYQPRNYTDNSAEFSPVPNDSSRVTSVIGYSGSSITTTSCNMYRSVTTPVCYPNLSEEQEIAEESSFASRDFEDESLCEASQANESHQVLAYEKSSSIKISLANQQASKLVKLKNKKLKRLEEKKIKSMKQNCVFTKASSVHKESNTTGYDDIMKTNESCLELPLKKRQSKGYYSSSTITKPIKQSKAIHSESVPSISAFSATESNICSAKQSNLMIPTPSCSAFSSTLSNSTVDIESKGNASTIRVSSTNVWRRLDKQVESHIPKKTTVESKNLNTDSDSDCLHIVSDHGLSQEESDNNLGITSVSVIREPVVDCKKEGGTNCVDDHPELKEEGSLSREDIVIKAAQPHIIPMEDFHESNVPSAQCDSVSGNKDFENMNMCNASQLETSQSDLVKKEFHDTRCGDVEESCDIPTVCSIREKRKNSISIDQTNSLNKGTKISKKNSESIEINTSDMCSVENNQSTINCNMMPEEGEIYDSDDGIEMKLHHPKVESVSDSVGTASCNMNKSTTAAACYPCKPAEREIANVPSITCSEAYNNENSIETSLIKQAAKQERTGRKQVEVEKIKTLFCDFRNGVVKKKDVIKKLCNNVYCTSLQRLSAALISVVQECNETLMQAISKQLETVTNCSCASITNLCSFCHDVKCKCEITAEVECPKCKKIRSESDKNKKQFYSSSKETFSKCHPHAGNLSHPVLTTFEKDLLTILTAVLKIRKFISADCILLVDLKLKIISSEKMLNCERLALCRFYAAICRLYNSNEKIIGLLFALAYGQYPHINFPVVFITCYSVWPSFIPRTNLLTLDVENSTLALYRIKLSPLTAAFQIIALVESTENKDLLSQRILEKLFSLKLTSSISSQEYYTQIAFELYSLLLVQELSFIKRTEYNIEVCPFVFSTIKAIELLCRRLGWEWTYNELIVNRIWCIMKSYLTGSSIYHADTTAIIIQFSGDLCRYGATIGSDLSQYTHLLISVLESIMESQIVIDSIEVSIVYCLLVTAPLYIDLCKPILKKWLGNAVIRKLVIPSEFLNFISSM